DHYQQGQLTNADFGERYPPHASTIQEIDRELPAIEASRDVLRINTLSTEEVMTEAMDLYKQWPSLAKEEQRAIVESVVERITIGKEDVSIALLASPPSQHADTLATHNQGFIAATSWTRAG
ncbi:MAG: hypothetical protein WD489_06555, partial [Rhodovibrionaceae bacterium]